MGFVAGGNTVIGLRLLGFAPKVPLPGMTKFYPVIWFGFVINFVSGVLLLVSYPTKALTNPVFYLKISCVAVGMILMVWLRKNVVLGTNASGAAARAIATISVLMWAGAIVSGRLLAYTYKLLTADSPCC